jgi:hypothetical protein
MFSFDSKFCVAGSVGMNRRRFFVARATAVLGTRVAARLWPAPARKIGAPLTLRRPTYLTGRMGTRLGFDWYQDQSDEGAARQLAAACEPSGWA